MNTTLSPAPTSPAISNETLTRDFVAAVQGKLEPEQIAAGVRDLAAATTAYAANGSIVSMLFYMQVQVQVHNGKTFDGKAGGLAGAGGGALFGTVYTSDINKLYSDTTRFMFTATPVYVSVVFFDKHSKVLGNFQAGAVSTVTGTGGGSGHWS